jgi:hypothetical protein
LAPPEVRGAHDPSFDRRVLACHEHAVLELRHGGHLGRVCQSRPRPPDRRADTRRTSQVDAQPLRGRHTRVNPHRVRSVRGVPDRHTPGDRGTSRMNGFRILEEPTPSRSRPIPCELRRTQAPECDVRQGSPGIHRAGVMVLPVRRERLMSEPPPSGFEKEELEDCSLGILLTAVRGYRSCRNIKHQACSRGTVLGRGSLHQSWNRNQVNVTTRPGLRGAAEMGGHKMCELADRIRHVRNKERDSEGQ